jgi:hypothetical protein
MQKYLVAVLFVIWVAIAVNAVLFAPTDASLGYWASVIWLLFLVFGNWYISAALFSAGRNPKIDGSTGTDAILPSGSVAFLVYSLFSAGSVLAYHVAILSPRLHLGIQIVALAVVAVVILIQLVAAKGASAGKIAGYSKRDLLQIARAIRLGVDKEHITAVDQFIEFVEYRMAHPAKLNQEKLKKAIVHLQDPELPPYERIKEAEQLLRSS